MATVKCALGHRGYPSHEWNDGVKDRIYCLGRIDQMTDELLHECKVCPDHVNKAQGDLEAFYGRDTICWTLAAFWLPSCARARSSAAIRSP